MSRRLALVLSVAVALAACGFNRDTSAPAENTSTIPSLGPQATLESFIGSLRSGDYPGTAELVDEAQLALFASIESGDPVTLIQMSNAGVTDEVRQNFWSSFVEAIPGLSGAGPDAVRLSEPVLFTSGESEFARIDAEFQETGAAGMWVLRQDQSAGWMVDVVATFGAAFVNPLTGWIRAMPPGQRGEVIGLVAGHADSWDALGSLQAPDDVGLVVQGALVDLQELFEQG